jgi:hypothetical protein
MATPRFEPLHPPPRSRKILVFLVGPVLWLVALVVIAVLWKQGLALQLGLIISFGSCALATIFLCLLRAGRVRRERDADRG